MTESLASIETSTAIAENELTIIADDCSPNTVPYRAIAIVKIKNLLFFYLAPVTCLYKYRITLLQLLCK